MLAEKGGIRTSRVIRIPYNPLIFQEKYKLFSSVRIPAIISLRKAQQYEKMLKQGIVKSHAELARKEHITRTRVSQIMNLLKLAPEIKQQLTNPTGHRQITESQLRKIVAIKDHAQQIRKFQEMKENVGITKQETTIPSEKPAKK